MIRLPKGRAQKAWPSHNFSRIIAIWALLFTTGFSPLDDITRKVNYAWDALTRSMSEALCKINPWCNRDPKSAPKVAAAVQFEWAMDPRYGRETNETMHGPKGFKRSYSITEHSQSQCYIDPEGQRSNPDCLIRHNWLVTFDASKSEGQVVEWKVQDGSCDSLTKTMIRCGFTSLGDHSVTLTVRPSQGMPRTIEQTITLKDLLIVSVGDSLASGEGVPDQVALWADVGLLKVQAAPAIWQDRRCHRSGKAGSALAAKAIEDADPHSSVTFVHLACSGAGINSGLIGYYAGQEPETFKCHHHQVANGLNSCPGRAKTHICRLSICTRLLQPQIDALAQLLCPVSLETDPRGRVTQPCPVAKTRKIDVLMISIGANDIEFGGIVEACLMFKNCPIRDHDHKGWPHEVNEYARVIGRANSGENLNALPQKYSDLAQSIIGTKLNVEPKAVLITEYFDPTHERKDQFCDRDGGDAQVAAIRKIGGLKRVLVDTYDLIDFEGLKPNEFEWAYDTIIKPLNQKIEASARQQSWTFVAGIQDAFLEHGVCANPGWVTGINASWTRQGDYDGTLHPNYEGHRQYVKFLGTAAARVAGIRETVWYDFLASYF